MKKIIKNGKIITPMRILNDCSVVIMQDKIECILDNDEIKYEQSDEVIDAGGRFVSPGFIDIHTHGGGGHDFMDGTVKSIIEAAKAHMNYGTTTIVPTTESSTIEEIFDTLDNFKEAKKNCKNCPELLGVHLEGPYFSMEQKGAQNPRYIRNPDYEEYTKILNYSNDIVNWTIAPELEGALRMGRELTERGILCSIGHSNATYEDILKAFENGYRHVTHLYSGMSMVRRINAFRYAGVVESAFLINELTVEIIADGVHLPESLLKLIYKIKGSDKICLVTDSMRAAGMPEGIYMCGSLKDGMKAVVEDGVAKLMDRTSFAGSVATADRLLKTMVRIASVPIQEAVKMMTLTPAKIMGIDNRKGTISTGKDADIVIFDDDINVFYVMVNGETRVNRL